MTLAALAESVEHSLSERADWLEHHKENSRIVYTVRLGKQMFAVTFEELAPDRQDPPV